MINNMRKITSVDEYISAFPNEVQEKLEEIRKIAHEIAPNADEKLAMASLP